MQILSKKTDIPPKFVENILKLLEDGSTIPFIARYRKELTGDIGDLKLREFEDAYLYTKRFLERREEVYKLIQERALMTDEIKAALQKCETLQTLEDIYRPFKEKKNTRASAAIAAGLEPLAKILSQMRISLNELNQKAESFVANEIKSRAEAIRGAQDILAETYSDDPKEREYWRGQLLGYGTLEIKATKSLQEGGLYEKLAGKQERISSIPSHRYLAVMRGVSEKQLSVKISVDMERVESAISKKWIPRGASEISTIALEGYIDGFRRLLFPSIEREVHSITKERADAQAIQTFGKNLSQLLLSPPVTKRVILGVDPAFRTGCKLAVINEHGTYLEHAVIYPTPPQEDYASSAKTIKELIQKHGITAVAIGNGTASRETQEFFSKFNKTEDLQIEYTVVSEAGASVYSASKVASEEYPNLDVTVRGAISIAQRLRDPMSALVKIDPKSLGIGQYQHDVDQKLLEKKLTDTTQDLVNRVGVDPNSASYSLLAHVSGIGAKLAKAIVDYREKAGAFYSKQELQKVKGLGAKAYEQCAGFFRIRDGKSILDNTGVHPENYEVATYILKNYDLWSLDEKTFEQIQSRFEIGSKTLHDILDELKKPGFDPREGLAGIVFRSDIRDIKELHIGSVVSGVVRNIVDFGAFVDIGLKNDALIHISQMSVKRISHPLEILSVNEELKNIKVLDVDVQKGKVSLTLLDS